MAITSAGYYGSVDDARWAALWNNCPIWFDSAAFIPTAVASARRVSLTAGIAFAAGIRDTSNSATLVDLNPPSSGGYWYLLVLRRTWVIGTGGTTTVVPLLGGNTDGSIPTTAPSTPPPGFQQTPATTYDAPITWVHVRAADTTLTIFDARLIATGLGVVAGASLAALGTARSIFSLTAGTLLRCIADQITYRWSGTDWTPVPSHLTYCALQLNGQRSTGANNGDLSWDTVLTDPSTMRDGFGIKALWSGRYRINVRAALQGAIPNSDSVVLEAVDAGGVGARFSQVGQWGLPGDTSMQLVDEIFLPLNLTVRFRLSWSGTSGARNFSYGADDTRARMSMRYLGPA